MRRSFPWGRTLAGLVAGGVLVLAATFTLALTGPGSARARPASAQVDREHLETLRLRGLAEIDRRIATLTEAAARLEAAGRTTPAHKAELAALLDAQKSGLTARRARVAADRRLAPLRADLARVVTDYRVYVLTVPKVRGIAAADIVLSAVDRLGELSERLASAVEREEDADAAATATADREALEAKLNRTRVQVENLASSLLALRPEGYPANRPTLESARNDLRSARAALREAAGLARKIVKDLGA